jgi:hypothetical protein
MAAAASGGGLAITGGPGSHRSALAPRRPVGGRLIGARTFLKTSSGRGHDVNRVQASKTL